MGKEGLPWEPNGKLVISVSSNGIWNLTNPWSQFWPAPHEEHELVFRLFSSLFLTCVCRCRVSSRRSCIWFLKYHSCSVFRQWSVKTSAGKSSRNNVDVQWLKGVGRKAWLMCSVWGLTVPALILPSAEKGGPWHSCSDCWRGDGGRGQAQFQCRNLALAKSLKWIALAFFPLNFCSLKQSFAFMRNKKLLQM